MSDTTEKFNEIIKEDVAFSFGTLFDKRLFNPTKIDIMRKTPNDVYFSFRKNPKYMHSAVKCDDKVGFSSELISFNPDDFSLKFRRNLSVIKRDWSLFRDSLGYAFNTQDALRTNYQIFFQCNERMGVFQHHRHNMYEAILIPLPVYQIFPSSNIPHIMDEIPFNFKRSAIVWRGSLSGHTRSKDSLDDDIGAYKVLYSKIQLERRRHLLSLLSRVHLAMASSNYHILNIGLVLNEKEKAILSECFPSADFIRDRLTVNEQLQNKYILALDGYDWPSNMYWVLQTNSVLLRQKSDWIAYGDNYFFPWKNYVPVDPDIHSILDTFDFLERNPAICEEIIVNAKRSFHKLFHPTLQRRRIRAIYEQYAKQLDD